MNNELDPIVKVNRPSQFKPPWWFAGYAHPELQDEGPIEFDARRIEKHVIPGQETAEWMCGTTIYDFHVKNKLLIGDFGIHEMIALQDRGLPFYQHYFNGVMGIAWKSLAWDLARRPNDLYVPFICVRTDKNKVPFLLRDWCKIDNAHTLFQGKAFRFI